MSVRLVKVVILRVVLTLDMVSDDSLACDASFKFCVAEAQHLDRRVLRTRLVTMLAYELGSGFLII